ncbi:MAG: hypothetical protein ACRCTE_02025 [Cellulosilyticaceae bacterium]
MNIGYIMLVAICVIAIIVLMMNISVVSKKEETLLKVVCIALFAFSMMRYLTLIVYGDHPTLGQLEVLRYFYLATSIGLTIPTASAVWYITPSFREKISYGKYLLLWIPWILFYIYVIITQPTKIVQGQHFGYALELTGKFPLYLSIAQGTFVTLITLLCLMGLIRYKNELLRSKYIIIILAQILLTLDGLSYYLPVLDIFPPFTVTEVFGFVAVFYAFNTKGVRKMKL